MNKIGKKLDSKFLSHLQGSIDVSPACVIIAEAPSGEVIYINEAVKRFRENDDIKINGDMIEDYMSSWKEYSSDGKLLSGEEMPLGRAILFGEIVDNEEIIVELDDGRKKWALASAAPVYDEDKNIIAAIEAKSQVGPSFGNNFNNRTEEALGSSLDLWTAYREGAFLTSPQPFLGFFFMLEDCPASNRPVKVKEPHFKVFPEFIASIIALIPNIFETSFSMLQM